MVLIKNYAFIYVLFIFLTLPVQIAAESSPQQIINQTVIVVAANQTTITNTNQVLPQQENAHHQAISVIQSVVNREENNPQQSIYRDELLRRQRFMQFICCESRSSQKMCLNALSSLAKMNAAFAMGIISIYLLFAKNHTGIPAMIDLGLFTSGVLLFCYAVWEVLYHGIETD